MSEQHTPAPWTYAPSAYYPHLVTLTNPSSHGTLFDLNDARLIVAAPDLLAALQGLFELPLCTFAVANARAAIAKATGEQS